MNIDLGSFAFGSAIASGGGTPSWGTALGQSKPDYKFTYPGSETIVVGMAYCAVPLDAISLPLGKGGRIYKASELSECLIASLFRKVYINGVKIKHPFIMVLIKEESDSHFGRKSIKYSDKNSYVTDKENFSNKDFVKIACHSLDISENACWFVYRFDIYNQDELHMFAVIVDENSSITYVNSSERKKVWEDLIPEEDKASYFIHRNVIEFGQNNESFYRPYITAIKSKPFLLLAGISGTGKSRIVRELARACWEEGSEEYKAQKPKNFEMIQVKPNWHDSSELIGYVSRVSGKAEFVAGDFLKFIAKAWENENVPHFLCLDEMNLAPVEQYFAEYLSVIESRKNKDGEVVTDAILEKCSEQWYFDLTAKLTNYEEVRNRFLRDGIAIPKNLIVVGTVNMDETTFSFSRKVLDRAMTIEMNEVDLEVGLENRYERIGKLGEAELIGDAVEGVDVYADNKEICNTVISYLKAINEKLEGTPFKVAYRTRNEFLLYVVNNLPYNKNENGEDLSQEVIIARALDEITNMKILSRIEGDTEKIGTILEDLSGTIKEQLSIISSGKEYSGTKGKEGAEYSVSLAKLKEMKIRLKSGYTSFWS